MVSGSSIYFYNIWWGEKEECFEWVYGECIIDLFFDIIGYFLVFCGDWVVWFFYNIFGYWVIVEEM